MEILRKIWAGWKRVGQVIGDFFGRLVLTVFYFSIFLPFGLGVRFLSDPLAIRRVSKVQWLERATHDLTMDDARRIS